MSHDAERAVLASVLFRPDAIMAIRDTVTPGVFATPVHRAIYAAMLASADDGDAPDLVNVSAVLEHAGHDDAASLLADLLAEPVTATYLPSYVDTLLAEARRRAVVAAATRVVEAVQHDASVDVPALLHQIVTDLPTFGAPSGPRSFGDMAPELAARFDQQRDGVWQEPVTPSGFPTLDALLNGGFRPGELVVLAARPGMGKTALSLALALHAARHAPALMFSLEMPAVSIIERAIADLAGVPMSLVRAKHLTAEQHRLLRKVLERMAGVPVYVDDTSGITTNQALARAQRFVAERPCSLIVADYLEILGDTNPSEVQRVGDISQRMKHLARVCNVPVILLSQLNREVEKNRPPIPSLAHIRQSGSIEANADIVLMLYRNDYYVEQKRADDDPAKQNTCDVFIRKQRNGATGTVTMGFRADTMTFTDPSAVDPWEMAS